MQPREVLRLVEDRNHNGKARAHGALISIFYAEIRLGTLSRNMLSARP
jgi:hypothetical protein